MKPLVLAGGGLAVAVVLVLVAMPSDDLDPAEARRLRGREAWYTGPMEEHRFDLLARLNDEKLNVTLKTDLVIRFQRGRDVPDVAPVIARHESAFREAALLYLSDLDHATLAEVRNRGRIRRHLLTLVESTLFPSGEARVRRVLFPTWQFQIRRGS